MIAGLTGHVTRFGPSRVFLEASGVEYEVHVPLSVFEALQSIARKGGSADVHLFVFHQFSNDSQRLYGFMDSSQRELFNAILDLKGIGPALALSILSHLDAGNLLDICLRRDAQALCRIPRIGKNTAETIIFEISRRREKWEKLFLSGPVSPEVTGASAMADERDLALQALLGLGYKESQIRLALDRVDKELPKASSAAGLIQSALRII